ncbi:MAG: type II secretion system F family protein [bacterium]
MPRFTYKARNAELKTIEGELVAGNEAEALARLDAMGYCPVWVREMAQEPEDAIPRARRRERIPHREVTVFTRQMVGLTKSGVPILKALRTVREQSANPRFCAVLAHLEETVRDGRMLSEALAQHPHVFSQLYVNMVRAGESAGILDVILLRLAEAREREDAIRRKLQAASVYPLLVLAVGVVTVFVVITFFMPKIAGMFRNVDDLPLPTALLIGLSEGIRHYWPWVLVPAVLLAAILRRIGSGAKGRAILDNARLRLPLIGAFTLQAEMARFSRTMSLLISAGIPVEKGLALSADTMTNSVLRNEMDEVRRTTVQQGRSIASGLKNSRHVPAYLQSMAAVGEEGGRLDEAFADVAFYYENELERQIGMMTSLVEPILILVVGAVVGFIVFAMMLPIFEMTKSMAR